MEYNTTDIVERFVKKYGRKPTKLEYACEYRETHQSEIKETKRKYKETHRKEIKESSDRYQTKRKEEVRLLRERLIAESVRTPPKNQSSGHGSRVIPCTSSLLSVMAHPHPESMRSTTSRLPVVRTIPHCAHTTQKPVIQAPVHPSLIHPIT